MSKRMSARQAIKEARNAIRPHGNHGYAIAQSGGGWFYVDVIPDHHTQRSFIRNKRLRFALFLMYPEEGVVERFIKEGGLWELDGSLETLVRRSVHTIERMLVEDIAHSDKEGEEK